MGKLSIIQLVTLWIQIAMEKTLKSNQKNLEGKIEKSRIWRDPINF